MATFASDTNLELIDLRRGDEDRYVWMPFEPNDDFTPHWWDHAPYEFDDPWFVQVRKGGVEVARLEFDQGDFGFDCFVDAPDLRGTKLEIQFFEVSRRYQRQGVGTEVIRLLAARHPGRRLLALSEGADRFWDSLGWRRFEHRKGERYRPLYVQPERGDQDV